MPASQDFDDPCKVRLKMVRLSYPNLFKARGFGKSGEGEKKFSATAIIDPETKAGRANIAKLEDAIAAAKEAKWGNKPPKLKSDKICLRDGDDDAEETKGMMICAASNAKRPLTLDENGDDVTEADDVLYGGCYVDMIVRVWAQDNEYGVRVNASLEGVKFRDDGDPFSGHSKTSREDFDDDDDDRGSRGRGRDKDDDDRGSRGRGRDDDDRGGRGRGRGRDDDDDDDRGSRGRGRGRDRDDDDDPPPRRRGGDKDDDKSERRRNSRSRDDDY